MIGAVSASVKKNVVASSSMITLFYSIMEKSEKNNFSYELKILLRTPRLFLLRWTTLGPGFSGCVGLHHQFI